MLTHNGIVLFFISVCFFLQAKQNQYILFWKKMETKRKVTLNIGKRQLSFQGHRIRKECLKNLNKGKEKQRKIAYLVSFSK